MDSQDSFPGGGETPVEPEQLRALNQHYQVWDFPESETFVTESGDRFPPPRVSERVFLQMYSEVFRPTLLGNPLLRRVLDKIIVNPLSGCWEWTGYLNKSGYGEVKAEGKKLKVHRYVYAQITGLYLPPERQLDHRCVNRPCCWWVHMELATHRQNNDAKLRDARHRSGQQYFWSPREY